MIRVTRNAREPMVTFKTSPDPQTMAEYADLYAMLVGVCSNCCLPPTKLKAALLGCHLSNPIIMAARTVGGPNHGTEDSFFADVGAHIRAQFSKFRDVANNMENLDRFQRKVWGRV